MKLRKKIMLLFLMMILLSMIMFQLVLRPIIVHNIENAEVNSVTEDVRLSLKILNREFSSVDKLATDWGNWNDSYNFVNGFDADKYIADNLIKDTFINHQVNFIAHIRSDGKVIHAEWFDLEGGQKITAPAGALEQITTALLRQQREGKNGEIQGYLWLADQPAYVASRLIRDSLRENTTDSYFIAGRYITPSVLANVAELTQADLRLALGTPRSAIREITNFTDANWSGEVETDIQYTANSIVGTCYFYDVNNQAVWQFAVSKDRRAFIMGMRTVDSAVAVSILIGVFFAVGVFYFVDRWVLRRLQELHSQVSTIKSFNDFNKPILVANDEIGQLGKSFSKAMQALKQYHDNAINSSRRDGLTQVYNRVYLQEYGHTLSEDDLKKLTLIMFDIDGLNLANDMYGYEEGDKVLCLLARLLEECFPSPMEVFRTGGDEFIILAFTQDPEEIKERIDSVQDALLRKREQDGLVSLESLSVGYIDNAVEGVNSFDEIIRLATRHLNHAKLLNKQSQRSYIVQSLRSALEARDYITDGHASRMALLAETMGEKLKLSKYVLVELQLLAEFHDIGKIGIADKILFKEGSLTSEEREEMKLHCEIGYRIAQSAGVLAPIADLVLKHHEWWDGSGYPVGLSGADIPVECRIISIVDAFDAMTNDRPYRKALSDASALEELQRMKGTQFDPALVEVFVDIIKMQ